MIGGNDHHRPQLRQFHEGQPVRHAAPVVGQRQIDRPIPHRIGQIGQRHLLLPDDHAGGRVVEAANQAGGVEGRQRPEHAQPNLSGSLGSQRGGLALDLPRLFFQAHDMLKEQPALERQRQPARVVPLEQHQAGHILELVQRLCHRGLRDVEHARRLGDAALLGDGAEVGALA